MSHDLGSFPQLEPLAHVKPGAVHFWQSEPEGDFHCLSRMDPIIGLERWQRIPVFSIIVKLGAVS